MAVIYRIFSIQVIDSAFLQNEGAKRHIKYKDIIPIRGTIFDKNNVPLAVSVINYDLYALKGFQKSQLLKLSELIELDIDYLTEVFEKKTLLKKNVSRKNLLEIKKTNLNNFEIEVRYSRHYPLGDQIAPLVGFYGTDGAQEGLEKVMTRYYQVPRVGINIIKIQNKK